MKRNEANYSFLLFTVQAQHFAMPLENLVEVTEEVHVSSLPFVPPYVDGLINLNSQIIPQIHAQQLLFSHLENKQAENQETLLVFKSNGPLYALRVGYVIDSVTVETGAVDFFQTDSSDTEADWDNFQDSNTQSALIEGEVNCQLSDGISVNALIFSPEHAEKLIADQNNQVDSSEEDGFLGELNTELASENQTEEFLIFSVGSRQFATSLNGILEVIDLQGIQKTQHGIDESTDIISGVALVRNNPLAVLDLKYWLKTIDNDHNATESDSVIILANDDYYCAIAIDNVLGMIEVDKQQRMIDPDTGQEMLNLDNNHKRDKAQNINEQAELNQEQAIHEQATEGFYQQKLIEIFSTTQFIQSPLFKAIETLLPKLQNSYRAPVKTLDVLKFQLHHSTYGILIDDIQRVINNHHIEPLLSPKAFISGSCEYDGLVIPVIDLASQLETKQASLTKPLTNDSLSLQERIKRQDNTEHAQQQEAIVVDYNQQSWALAIDESERIIEVKETDIDFLPERKEQLIKAYASFDDELVHLLNIEAICAFNT